MYRARAVMRTERRELRACNNETTTQIASWPVVQELVEGRVGGRTHGYIGMM